MTIDVVSYGLGPIGCGIADCLLGRQNVKIVGAVDTDLAKVGRDLGELVDGARTTGVVVTDDPARALAVDTGGVVVHATSSKLHAVASQLEDIVSRGWNVVSTYEELSWPTCVDAGISESLDAKAKKADVSILASGINPGFLMDSLVLVLTGACTRVDAVRVRRIVDTNKRRTPLQKKVGVGMTQEEFQRLAAQHSLGHVGLVQSAHMIADRLGWKLTDYEETLKPSVAEHETETGLGVVPVGGVLGQRQVAVGRVGDREVIRYELDMVAGGQAVDAITIEGEPPIRQVIEGGVDGDVGTEAIIANLIRLVAEARPGLLTMMDVMPFSCDNPPAR